MRKKENKSIIDLIIDYENCTRRIERLQDPDYVATIAAGVFKDRPPRDYSGDIAKIIDTL